MESNTTVQLMQELNEQQDKLIMFVGFSYIILLALLFMMLAMINKLDRMIKRMEFIRLMELSRRDTDVV